jgi:hypothetical protein
MQYEQQSTGRTGGLWLAAGAALLSAALVFHGPPDADLSVQMEHVSEGRVRWALVHWTAAVALFLMSGGALLNLVMDTSVRRSPILGSAWTVMALGAIATLSTAVSEASVLAAAAETGDTAAFFAWGAFAGGMGNGFWALALATALIAFSDARADDARLPRWASIAGTAFGVLSATGWTLGEQLGIGIGGPIWLISSLAMCVWLVWYGVSIPVSSRHPVASSAVRSSMEG